MKNYKELQPYLDTELEDDETPNGGISFVGETLFDFLCGLSDNNITTMEEVNQALKENGIKEIKIKENKHNGKTLKDNL